MDNLLLGLQNSRTNPQWNLLVSFYLYTYLFLLNTSIKQELIPSQWIPNSIKSVFETLLWLPYKFRKYIRITRLLFNTYRIDRKIFLNSVEMLTRRKYTRREEEKYTRREDFESKADQFTVGKLRMEVVNNYENLRYHVPHFPKAYPWGFEYFFEKGTSESTKSSAAYLLAKYLDRHYLHSDFLYHLKNDIEADGYLDTINKPYYNYLDALEEDIKTGHLTAEYWNKKGIVYGCLENVSEAKNPSKKVRDETAIYCYNKAIEIYPDYAEAWNNKGIEYIEKDQCDKSAECFLKAAEYARVAFSGDIDLADIYNNLGVTYYGLKEYVKALDSFETALRLDKHFELAKHNKLLTIQQIGKRRKIYKSDGSATYE
jgi:tetratricopeptide (TPR) repeat protein